MRRGAKEDCCPILDDTEGGRGQGILVNIHCRVWSYIDIHKDIVSSEQLHFSKTFWNNLLLPLQLAQGVRTFGYRKSHTYKSKTSFYSHFCLALLQPLLAASGLEDFSGTENCAPAKQKVLPSFTAFLRQRYPFTQGEYLLRFPPGSPWGTFIAARSAPDPTLDMDLRVGNFLLAE